MKKNTIFGVSILLGLFIGYAIWGNEGMGSSMNMKMSSNEGGHMMPDGTMMGSSMKAGNMTMGSMMDDMMANLKGKTGDDFDKAFLSEMIMHHEGAVVMAKAVLTSSNRPELKKLANEIIGAQNNEIGQMQTWYKMWFATELK